MGSTLLALPGAVTIVRWTARGLAALLVLFWGSFLVHHLNEWFLQPQQLPPLWVILTVGLHLLMLVGLVVGWRWEVAGALLVVACAVPFFWVSAGRNFLLFAAVTCLPAALWLALAFLGRGGAAPGPTP
jgi:hypothetical protein